MKTKDLIGPALNWAVGDSEFKRLIAEGAHVKQWVLDQHNEGLRTDPYSTNWLFGGPIIEREGIHLYVDESKLEWVSSCWGHQSAYHGPTPLIAAMRCFVASKLGDAVTVPEALL